MQAFLTRQLDYIFLFYGMSFILVALVVLGRPGKLTLGLPWHWLGLFGVTHGTFEWLCALELGYPDLTANLPYYITKQSLGLVSFMLLFEFGRGSLNSLSLPSVRPRFYIPLIAVCAAAPFWGGAEAETLTRYLFGLAGGLMASCALYKSHSCAKIKDRRFYPAAVSLAVYSVLTGAVTPQCRLFPASMINDTAFLHLTSCPIQLWRGVAATILSISLWRAFMGPSAERSDLISSLVRWLRLWAFVLSFLVVIAIGWVTTELSSRRAERQARTALLAEARVASAAINPEEHLALAGDLSDLQKPQYADLRELFFRLEASNPSVRWIYTMVRRNGRIKFVIDSVPDGEWGHTPPGVVYEQVPPELERGFDNKQALLVGPYQDEWGEFVSAFIPLIDPQTDSVYAVLGLDFELSQLSRIIAHARSRHLIWVLLFGLVVVLLTAHQVHSLLAEEQLARSEELLRKTTSAAHDAIFVLNEAGNITFWNHAAQELFGWQPAEVIGQPFEPLFKHLGSSLMRSCETAGAALAGDRSALLEAKVVAKDGTAIDVEFTFSELTINHSRLAIIIARNITDRKLAEATLRRYTAEVEESRNQIEKQTAELIRQADELRLARDFAESAAQLKSEFLANMSHEIRTPMNGIIGMTNLCLETALTPEQQEYINIIKASADSLLILINDILDFSKIEAGKMEIHAVTFEPARLIRNLASLIRPKAADNKIDFTVNVDPSVPAKLIGDDVRLGQVILNLLGNAVKFTAPGGKVHLNLTSTPSRQLGGETLECSVADTGIGIGAEKLELIFDAFAQADTSTTRQYGGTGLGLTISKKLVTLLGGTIGVQSEEGKGSTFYFSVPLKRIGPAIEPAASPQAAKKTTGGQFELNVLLAEDNTVNQRVIQRTLERLGCTVTIANDGAEAVRLFQTQNTAAFAMIFMDCQMPVMDGFDATQRIREFERHSTTAHIPIVALTADALDDTKERCFSVGMDDFISKPCTKAEIEQVLERWCRLS